MAVKSETTAHIWTMPAAGDATAVRRITTGFEKQEGTSHRLAAEQRSILFFKNERSNLDQFCRRYLKTIG